MKKLLVREKAVATAKAEEERDTPVTVVASEPIGAAVVASEKVEETVPVVAAATSTEEEKKPEEEIPLAVATEVPAQQ
jgi:hypothetical protein